jgi:hypothetical protein
VTGSGSPQGSGSNAGSSILLLILGFLAVIFAIGYRRSRTES